MTGLPKTVELLSTEPNQLSHERSWFVMAIDSDEPLYSADNDTEDASIRACETWLENRGYKVQGSMPPQCFEYKLQVSLCGMFVSEDVKQKALKTWPSRPATGFDDRSWQAALANHVLAIAREFGEEPAIAN